MVGRIILLGLAIASIASWSGCDCEPKHASQEATVPDGFEEVMKEHAALSIVARNALIRGDLPVAQQAMRKLAFFMEHVPFPEQGKETRESPESSPGRCGRPRTSKRRAWHSPGSRTHAENATTRWTVALQSSSSRHRRAKT